LGCPWGGRGPPFGSMLGVVELHLGGGARLAPACADGIAEDLPEALRAGRRRVRHRPGRTARHRQDGPAPAGTGPAGRPGIGKTARQDGPASARRPGRTARQDGRAPARRPGTGPAPARQTGPANRPGTPRRRQKSEDLVWPNPARVGRQPRAFRLAGRNREVAQLWEGNLIGTRGGGFGRPGEAEITAAPIRTPSRWPWCSPAASGQASSQWASSSRAPMRPSCSPAASGLALSQ
jgi:hypothetical protein